MLSKWALKAFTIGLADQFLPYGIIVNAIAPGPVATPMLHKEEGDSIYMENQPSGRYRRRYSGRLPVRLAGYSLGRMVWNPGYSSYRCCSPALDTVSLQEEIKKVRLSRTFLF